METRTLHGAVTDDKTVADNWMKAGLAVRPLYAAPPSPQAAMREALEHARTALSALKQAVHDSGTMNGREYVSLGIQVNNSIDKARAALSAQSAVPAVRT
jgi:hypothetical protein